MTKKTLTTIIAVLLFPLPAALSPLFSALFPIISPLSAQQLVDLGAPVTVNGPRKVADNGQSSSGYHVLSGVWSTYKVKVNGKNVEQGLKEFNEIDAKNGTDATVYDFTNVVIPANASISPAASNKNTLFIITQAQYDTNRFYTSNNTVRLQTDGSYLSNSIVWYDGFPFYDALTIQANSASYYRQPTSKYLTVALPFDNTSPLIKEGQWTNVTANVLAYELGTVATANGTTTITMSEVPLREMKAYQPYVLEANVDLTKITKADNFRLSGDGATIDFTRSEPSSNAHIAFVPNFANLTTEATDNIYVLTASNGTALKQSVNGRITPFRGYFQLSNGQTASNIAVLFDSQTTGLHPATEEAIAQLFNVYSIDGKPLLRRASSAKVATLSPGLYIINGHKVTVR